MLLRFLRDRRGAILPIFAIAAVPLIVSTGAVVDYTNAFDQKMVVQDSMDAAALAAGKKIGILTTIQIKADADAFFVANVAGKVTNMPTLATSVTASTIDLSTTLTVPTYFLGMIGLNYFTFNMKAQATQALGTLEVALALDNSGSMSGTKMATLLVAAADLADKLYSLGATSTKPDPIKLSLVPFASSVKVDPANKTAAWMDTTGVAPYNAESFEGFTGAPPVSNNTPAGKNVLNMYNTLSGTGSAWAGCMEERKAPYDVQDDAAATATPGTMFVPMFAPDEPDNWTCTTGTCSNSGTTNANRRYNGAPTGLQNHNNYLPDAGTTTTCGTTTISIGSNATVTSANHGLVANNRVVFHTTGSLPTGVVAGTTYYVRSSSLTANSFRISTTSGGGGMTTSGSQSGTHSLTNNWTCQSGSANCLAAGVGRSEQVALLGQSYLAAAKNICKYGTVANKAAIAQITVETDGGTYPGGPNFNCTTDQVVPLTPTKATIKTAIANMAADGTTNITAGLMWGWRTLSPVAPYTEGRAYSTAENQKILILMTDGENTYFANGKFPVSHYGAWGYVWKSHLGTTSSDEAVMQSKMEERMAQACINIKAAGVKVYTVAFEITDVPTKALLAACTNDPDTMAFDASSPAELLAAFTAIGDQITLLRLAQ